MADIKVRNLDDGVVACLKARAERAGVSLEEEVRRTLARSVVEDRAAIVARLEERLRAQRARHKQGGKGSVELIDEIREDMARRLG